MARPSRYGIALIALLAVVAGSARADLDAYFKKPEPAYKWELKSETKMQGGTLYRLHLVSQTWHDIVWEHNLSLFRPEGVKHPEMCALYNTGGNGDPTTEMYFSAIAKQAGTSLAVLYNIPNQPLYGGKTEDALVVETWKRFLESGDESWPLHFPMAKAVLKSMDAIQAFVKERNQTPITGFMVTGGSKRGWTAWLVGASRDPRVKAIAPMVIDTLNLPLQVKAQQEVYGAGGSEQIDDYAKANLLGVLQTAPGKRLVQLEDPYSYRDRYTMPKLLVLGTNDPYWPQGALNYYWDGLPGPKWVLYAPNSGHGLDDRMRVAATLIGYINAVANGEKLPAMQWKYSDGPTTTLTVTSTPAPKSARLFQATADTMDFRKSKWTSTELPVSGDTVKATLPTVESGNMSNYAELTYEMGGHTFTLCTQVKVRSAK